jgi:LytR cell envelope-related transcriptional attenuator
LASVKVSNAVGVVAGLALATVLGFSWFDKPRPAQVTTAEPVSVSGTMTASPGVAESTTIPTTAPRRATTPPAIAAKPLPVTTAVAVTVATTGAPASAPATTQPSVVKSAVKVGVVNSSGKAGVATSTANKLTSAGWSPATEPASLPATAFSVVYYRPGQQDTARAVAASLGLPDSLVIPGAGLAWETFAARHYDVLVVASKDLR